MAGRLASSSTAFFLCDVQERFRPLIRFFPSVINVAQKMVHSRCAAALPPTQARESEALTYAPNLPSQLRVVSSAFRWWSPSSTPRSLATQVQSSERAMALDHLAEQLSLYRHRSKCSE